MIEDLSFNYAHGVLGALAILVFNLRRTASRKLISRVEITKEHYKNSLIFTHSILHELSEHSGRKELVKRDMNLAGKRLEKSYTDINVEINELFVVSEQLKRCLNELEPKTNKNLFKNAVGASAVSVKIGKSLEKEFDAYSQRRRKLNHFWFSTKL